MSSSNNNNSKNRRVRSLRDMDALEGSSFTPSGKVSSCEMKIAHIPTLSHNADACLHMLQRIRKEFYPIADRRGFSVLSVSEMCCCGDGLDHGVVESGTSKRRKRRKRKVMAKNVLGYNQTHFQRGGKKTHTIHLRLRHANNHNVLMSYEEVAGTMAHELAHCIHGPHNAKFYKLMDEIQEQHATFMVRGIVADNGGFPVNSREAHVLGGGNANNNNNNNANTKASAAAAAEARKKKKRWMPQGPQKLGGDSSWKKWYTPGEAAAAAAEARRLEDEVWCQPCNDDDALVELLSSSSDEEEEDRKLPAATNIVTTGVSRIPTDEANRVTPTGSTCATIDLTGDSDDDKDNVVIRPTLPQSWPCKTCTYQNEPQVLVCTMCNAEKSDLSARLIEKLTRDDIAKSVRDDAIQRAKELEVVRAKEEFGFNIYGNDDDDKLVPTSTMKHIT